MACNLVTRGPEPRHRTDAVYGRQQGSSDSVRAGANNSVFEEA